MNFIQLAHHAQSTWIDSWLMDEDSERREFRARRVALYFSDVAARTDGRLLDEAIEFLDELGRDDVLVRRARLVLDMAKRINQAVADQPIIDDLEMRLLENPEPPSER